MKKQIKVLKLFKWEIVMSPELYDHQSLPPESLLLFLWREGRVTAHLVIRIVE